MSIEQIKRAVERHYSQMPSMWSTAYEGVNFDPPDGNYVVTQFKVNKPSDPTLGLGYHRENLQFQAFVLIPRGKGTGDATRQAELIRNRFAKGTYLNEAGIRIYVLNTPSVGSATIVQGRIMVPVLVDLIGEVET